jgi:hypothetical protein
MESAKSLEEINRDIIVPLLKAKARNEYHTELYEFWLSENRVFKLLDEATSQIRQKGFCKKWLDNEPGPCPIQDLEKCCETKKPCDKAELVVFLKEILAIWEGDKKE